MIRLAFRFDDPSATSDHELERGVICALQDHGMRATFGVIPFRSSDGRLVALNRASGAHLIAAADAGTIEIALHGHSHVSRVSSGQPNSEFDGVPAAEQLALLQEASAHLQSLCGPLPGLIPPWNRYDRATLSAAEKLGFAYVSGGRTTPGSYRGPVKEIPATCRFKDLEAAVDEARQYRLWGPLVVTVMHHYDFAESGSRGAVTDLSRFRALLGRIGAMPDVQVATVGEIATRLNQRDARRGLRSLHLATSGHWRVRRFLPNLCSLTRPVAASLADAFASRVLGRRAADGSVA